MNTQRRYILENIVNCRDLGGYPSEFGCTKFGRFIRCGTVDRPTESDIKALGELNISTVIDLRGDFEFNNQPNDFERLTDNVNHVSLYELNVAEAKNVKMTLPEVYEFIVDNYKENICRVLKTIAEAPDGTVLYHCFLGKDRTGILSMLLLTIAGVGEDDIVADYQLTYTYLENYIHTHADSLWDTNAEMHYSLPQTMRTLIAYIKDNYGSVMEYIRKTGVEDSEINKIRRRFFD